MEAENLTGKVVVITGASAGLGRAMARAFAREKTKIGLLARGLDGLEGAKEEVEELGGKAITIKTDVADPKQVEDAAQQVEDAFGSIDIWINNAMVSVFSPLKEIEADEFRRVTEVTYLGQVYGTMAALKKMLPRNKGQIILIGSALAYRGIPLQSAYCGAKHAIHGFFESLRAELIHDNSNIQLSMVQMPAMNTTQFDFVKSRLPNKPKPMGTIFEPEVAANAVVYTAKHPYERELNVGFSTVKTILGNKVAPGYLDHFLAQNGYSGQQTNEAADPDRPNNLWEPISGDHGARGNFDKSAKNWSPQLWTAKHAGLALTSAATLGLGLAVLVKRKLFG